VDDDVRLLERAAARGDADAAVRLATAQCRIGRHDWRCDRLCAWCQRQRPGLTFWKAMQAGEGRGAQGWMGGWALGVAMGTTGGLPKLERKQPSLVVQFFSPNQTGPGQGKVFPREQWDPPYDPVPWDRIKRRMRIPTGERNDLGRSEYRVLARTPHELLDVLEWEPFCTDCDGRGYWIQPVSANGNTERSILYIQCNGCALPIKRKFEDHNRSLDGLVDRPLGPRRFGSEWDEREAWKPRREA